jgi:hypothetical protein
MRPGRRLAFAAVIAFMALPLRAAVTVSYGDPALFTDAGDGNNDPDKVMLSLARHLERLGDRYLPAQSNLKIEVLDLDRAGRPRMNLPTEIRIVSGRGDMPCIDLNYTLDAGNKASPPRRERVCDPDYLRSLEPQYSEHDPLVYEKRMLEQWFRARFAGTAAPR